MNRDMRDYMDRRDMRNYDYDDYDVDERYDEMRDGRNPYGSRGGYVRDHEMRDGSHMRFRGTVDNRYDERYYDDRGMTMGDGRRGRRRDRMMEDYGTGLLSKKELRHWQNKLCEHMDQHECQMFEFEPVIHQAEQMQIKFDRYSKEEFYTTVLMMFTDYHKTIGQNVPMYLSLAKDFLEDHDSKVKYGEKLACYFDHFVMV